MRVEGSGFRVQGSGGWRYIGAGSAADTAPSLFRGPSSPFRGCHLASFNNGASAAVDDLRDAWKEGEVEGVAVWKCRVVVRLVDLRTERVLY